MAVFTLTLVRHGETLANKQGIVQGQQDTELSDKGLRQAELLGIRLQQDHFTHVYASDLKRAYQTCESILKCSTCSKCQIIQDQRLRERKFGVIEGKHRSVFIAAKKKAKCAGADFTPSGGESNQELRARGVNFFQDLCQQLRSQIDADNGNEAPPAAPGSKKRRHNTPSVSSDVFPSPDSTSSTSFAASTTTTAAGVDFQNNSTAAGGQPPPPPPGEDGLPKAARSRTSLNSGSTSSTSGCSSMATAGSTERLSEQLSPDIHTRDVSEGFEPYSQQQQQQPWRGSDEPPGGRFHPPLALRPLSDADIRAAVIAPPPAATLYGQPNVSLSPIVEHRFPSLSSISSGRSNSFDDGDAPAPLPLADVLVVTHGGLIRQLIGYFVDELGCKIPCGKLHALQTTPNTGLSKFTVSLGGGGGEGDDLPVVTCLSVHDQDHLIGQDIESLSAADEA